MLELHDKTRLNFPSPQKPQTALDDAIYYTLECLGYLITVQREPALYDVVLPSVISTPTKHENVRILSTIEFALSLSTE